MDVFYQDDCTEGPQSGLGTVVSQTYEESVRDLIHDERHYLRDLHMIIKVIIVTIIQLIDYSPPHVLFLNVTMTFFILFFVCIINFLVSIFRYFVKK